MLDQHIATTNSGYVLEYKDAVKQGFLGYIPKHHITTDHNRPDFEPQAHKDNKSGAVLLDDLQHPDVYIHTVREKAETSKSILEGLRGQQYTISIVRVDIHPRTKQRTRSKKNTER